MWLLLLLSFAGASVVDRVVAVVDAHVVLASDADLNRALSGFESPPLGFWHRNEATIEAALVRAAAGDLAIYQPDSVLIDKRLARWASSPEWSGFTVHWGLSKADLQGLVRHRLIVEAWLARNISVATDQPSAIDAEITRLLQGLEQRIRVRRVPVIDP